MKQALRLILTASIALTAPAVGTAASRPVVARSTETSLERRIDTFATHALASRATVGLAIGVARRGHPVFLHGYGLADLEARSPVTERTVFRIGSITKEFTAASILLLVERGLLSLDDPLSKWLPSFPRRNEVTIRQLLTHTSGIHNYTSLKDFAATSHLELPTAALVDVIAHQQPLFDFPPGTSYNYSNSGFFLLGAVIEKISGQSYNTFVIANVLAPLGLNDTRPDVYAEIVPGRASGYEVSKDAPSGFNNASYISITAAAAAGAMRSTVGDLLRWHDALLGGKLLKASSLALMLTPGRLKDGRLASVTKPPAPNATASDYGFGITLGNQHGRRTIGHGGSINGFNASLETYPDDGTTIVLLTNTGGASYALAPELADAVFEPLPAAAAARFSPTEHGN